MDISRVKGDSLCIQDTDKYDYILTYSFPCQDLSLAGHRQGMERGSGTRSGLLWQVERILQECKDMEKKGVGGMPSILLMENVTQIHGVGNDEHFKEWQLRLEELGYQSYWEDLNAVDYGIPQSRNRTFMVSIYGDYNYRFPKKSKLKLRLKDLLQKSEDIDEKLYLSDKQIEDIKGWNAYEKPLEKMEQIAKDDISPTITTRTSEYTSSMILVKRIGNYSPSGHNAASIVDPEGVAPTVMENHGTITAVPRVIAGIGDKKSNSGTQWYQQDRIYDGNEVAIALATSFNPYYATEERVSKLSPKECFRLQGLKDEDIRNVMEHQSDSQAWHLSGDSICVVCLMAIFGAMVFDDSNEWKKYFDERKWWSNE